SCVHDRPRTTPSSQFRSYISCYFSKSLGFSPISSRRFIGVRSGSLRMNVEKNDFSIVLVRKRFFPPTPTELHICFQSILRMMYYPDAISTTYHLISRYSPLEELNKSCSEKSTPIFLTNDHPLMDRD